MQANGPSFLPASTVREPVVLLVDGQKVFGVIHRPTQSSASPHPAMLILHGFVGSKDQPHQIFVKLAEALAKVGIVALRIDLRGRGDSEGDMAVDVTPAGDLADCRAAIDFLANQPDVDRNRLGVLGLSWGAALAAVLAGQDQRLTCAVSWNGGTGAHLWQPKGFQEIDGRPVLEIWGNLVGKQFYADMSVVNVLENLRKARGPVLVVQSEADEAVHEPVQTAHRIAKTLEEAGIKHELIIIAGADHALMRYVWEREAIERTVDWLKVQF